MSNIRGFVSLAYLLYICNDRQASVDYSDGTTNDDRLILKADYTRRISEYLGENIDSILMVNPLLTGQFEYILVAMERIFCLGSVRFNDGSYNNSKERTGGKRYPKTLKFSTNMFVLDLIVSGIEEQTRKKSLTEWLRNKRASDLNFETKISQFLTICSQYALFKARTSDKEDVVYRTIGIYERLKTNEDVSISDAVEQVGTSSIYSNVLKEGLNPWLNSRDTSHIKLNDEVDITPYLEMLETTLDIVKVSESDIATIKSNHRAENKGGEFPQDQYMPYLTAIRTKPFVLLAGISGTGKSRIVRELAFKSCPVYLRDNDGTTPGNYCMIEVKPNWHDSTELLGYYSNLTKGYQFTRFVRFLVKAKMFPDVPFFVCLDEMNLAPVEQYFAEVLSVLETRKHVTLADGREAIKTGAIVEPVHFRKLLEMPNFHTENGGTFSVGSTDRDIYLKLFSIDTESDIDSRVGNRTDLTTEGLTLPDNVVIIGTVNMDDTTHQFSRKVIDRAMTIEMNGGRLMDMFGDSHNLEYLPDDEQRWWQQRFRQHYVLADEVLQAYPGKAGEIKTLLTERLEAINRVLHGTPFEVSYRVLNELTVMLGVMLDDEPDAELRVLAERAVDNILLMKILPRIEGDSDMFALSAEYRRQHSIHYDNRLEWLRAIAPDLRASEAGDTDLPDGGQADAQDAEPATSARDKIQEMVERLGNQEFTRFWP